MSSVPASHGFSRLDVIWLKRSWLGWRFSRPWPGPLLHKKLSFNSRGPATPRMPRYQALVERESAPTCHTFRTAVFESFELHRLARVQVPLLHCGAKLVANISLAILYSVGMLRGMVAGLAVGRIDLQFL